jgi:hypothetical protein
MARAAPSNDSPRPRPGLNPKMRLTTDSQHVGATTSLTLQCTDISAGSPPYCRQSSATFTCPTCQRRSQSNKNFARSDTGLVFVHGIPTTSIRCQGCHWTTHVPVSGMSVHQNVRPYHSPTRHAGNRRITYGKKVAESRLWPMPRRDAQLSLSLAAPRGWGGRRPGAGRKPGSHPGLPHTSRKSFRQPLPAHVTVRLRRGLPSLRTVRIVREIERSFTKGCARPGFRLVHYSLQGNHAHLIVEARNAELLGRGMMGIGARLARAVNRVAGRSGRVFDGRYHSRLLHTPKEVRAALRYVLLNARHHVASASRQATVTRAAVAGSTSTRRRRPAGSRDGNAIDRRRAQGWEPPRRGCRLRSGLPWRGPARGSYGLVGGAMGCSIRPTFPADAASSGAGTRAARVRPAAYGTSVTTAL